MASLPVTTPKVDLVAAHVSKMFMKAQRRARGRILPMFLTTANLSRNHPDYGQPLAIHLANKEQRQHG